MPRPSLISPLPFIRRHLIVRQFIKFATVGLINTGVDFAVYALLLYSAHAHYLAAKTAAFVVAAVVSYFLNRRWTFRSTDPGWQRQMSIFFAVITTGFFINLGLLYVVVEYVRPSSWLHLDIHRLDELAAYIMATGIVLIWNFSMNRWLTFRIR